MFEIRHRPFILSSLYRKFRLEIRYRRNGVLKSGEIRIRGYVEIWNGKYHQRARNHFVGSMLNQLINQIATNQNVANVTVFTGSFGFGNWSSINSAYMLIGTDTANKTIITTGALSAPIGGASPVKPNTQSGSTAALSNGASCILTSTWNAGTVSGSVGEIGIYGTADTTALVGFGSSVYNTSSSFFASRLSVADGDFSAFVINAAAPLTINWTIQFTFA